DPERLLVLQAVPDQPLVALLEDVEGQELAGQDHGRKLEDRQLDALCGHPRILGTWPPRLAESRRADRFRARGASEGHPWPSSRGAARAARGARRGWGV